MGLEEEIRDIEEEIADTPYNKSTEAHIGRLKAKLAEKKEKLEQQQSGSGGGPGYAVEKHGDATVALVGFPSVGKSHERRQRDRLIRVHDARRESRHAPVPGCEHPDARRAGPHRRRGGGPR